MAERWTDHRLDVVLADVGEHLDVPTAANLDPLPAVIALSSRRRRWIAVAALVLLVIAGLVVVAPARETVARWFGLRIEEIDEDEAVVTATFGEDVTALDVDAAIAAVALDPARLDGTPLGRPDAAGIPPEGGVLLAWERGETTLWVRPGDDGSIVVKRLPEGEQGVRVDGVGQTAVLFERAHVLATPSRRVAAGRVLWWLTEDQELRLESDLDAATMIAIGAALGAP